MSYQSAPEQKPTVLVIDDSPDILSLVGAMLKDQYRVKLANSGERALKLAASGEPPDIILLDILMPDMDGYEVCRRLKGNPELENIPIIFLTAMTGEEDETRGLQIGAVDYVTKPISFPILRARLSNQLDLKQARDQLRNQNRFLEEEIQRRVTENSKLQDITIHTMASLAETRDNETGNHIRRTQFYVKTLAEKLSTHPRFSDLLGDEHTIDLLFKSAPLHDIGKVGIPDSILLKPGKLTPDEWDIMKTHAAIGRDAIERAENTLGEDWPFLRFAKEITYSHHEKWDGSGYPQGLSGEEIPISARLMALADVYDALINKRVYKPPMTHAEARAIIVEGKGAHFDPDVVEAFLDLESEFSQIAEKYADHA
jgi:putative two-component system response regulator